MSTYRDHLEPADMGGAIVFYEMLLLLQDIEGMHSVAERVDWVKANEPELYADLLLLDLMRAVKNGR